MAFSELGLVITGCRLADGRLIVAIRADEPITAIENRRAPQDRRLERGGEKEG